MKKIKPAWRGVILLLFLLTLALPVFATHGGIHLVPECRGGVKACTVCDLFVLTQNILNFIWWVITLPLAALFLAYGGVLLILPYLGAPAKMFERGRAVIRQALIGILIVLVAWLAIDTIIKVVGQQAGLIPKGTTEESFGTDILLGPWYEITCSAPEISVTTPPPPPPPPPTGTPPPPPPPSGPTLTNEQAVTELTAAGVQIKSTGNCDEQNISTCTSLEGIPESAVDELLSLQAEIAATPACTNCYLIINGGTEVGHDTHGTGKSIVDLDDTSEINDFIIGKRIQVESVVFNTWYKDVTKNNLYYYYEGDHWHTCLNTSDCPQAVGAD